MTENLPHTISPTIESVFLAISEVRQLYTTEFEKGPYFTVKVNVAVGVGATAGFPVPVTVKVYVPAVVPGVVIAPPPLPPPPPPQPGILPNATITTKMPIRDRQLRRFVGIQRNMRKAKMAPLSAPAKPLPSPTPGRDIAVVGAVVLTVTVAVPVEVLPPRVTVELPLEQVGRCAAPAGLDVRAQVMVTAPEKPVVVLIVTVEVEDVPALTAAGVVAASENADCVTETDAVLVPAV